MSTIETRENGVGVGCLVVKVNGQEATSVDDFGPMIAFKNGSGVPFTLTLQRPGFGHVIATDRLTYVDRRRARLASREEVVVSQADEPDEPD